MPFTLFGRIAGIPLECFQAGKVLYGDNKSGASKNDLDLIESLSSNHVLTKVRSCNLGNGLVGSI